MEKNKIIRTAIYIRVSTEEQTKHGFSLESQEQRLKEFCKDNNYKIVDSYKDEGKSARSKLNQRKELIRLLEDVKNRKIDRIVFIKLDRWFRNVSDYYKIQEILEKNKVDWICSNEDYNTTTSSGRLNLNIRLSIAQDEADRAGDRVRFTFENMIRNKRPIQGSHCFPLGYKVDGIDKDKKVVKDEKTSQVVKDMFEYFEMVGSVRKTLIYINQKYNMTIHYDSMSKYIKNEIYSGTYKSVENFCENYITKEQYLKNQSLIKKNVKDNNKKHDYIFSGLIKCRCCNCNMSGFKHRATKPKYNKVYAYFAYRCNKAYNSKNCENRSPILETKLENYLIDNIIKEAEKYIITEEKNKIKENQINIDDKKIKSKIDRLAELYIDGKISREKYDNDFKKYNNELKQTVNLKTEKQDLKILKSLVGTDSLNIYNQLNNTLKRTFWATYIDYIERDEKMNFKIHFK